MTDRRVSQRDKREREGWQMKIRGVAGGERGGGGGQNGTGRKKEGKIVKRSEQE